MPICQNCLLDRPKYCKNICNKCYDKQRRTGKYRDHRNKLKRIYHRKKNNLPIEDGRRLILLPLTHCIDCKCEIKRSRKESLSFHCYKCYKKKYYQKNKEKLQKEANNKLRIKKGLPLDHKFKIGKIGEGHLTKEGYKVIWKPQHQSARKDGAMFEHVFIMSEHLGRPIRKGETIHHKNGVRDDNRIENLELWNKSQPAGQRIDDKIKFYKEFLEQYGYEVTKR